MSPAASARWCPTPEQLMILEEMYRSGVRTPSATQIQQITAHLSLYGKIEGKNVFYWFQNHKARDRQKLRRKLTKQLQQQQQQQHLHQQQQQHQLFQPHISPNCSFCYSYFDHHQSLASALAYRPMGYYNNPTTAPPSASLSMSYPPQVGINSGGGSRLMTDYNSWKREIIGGDHHHQKEEIDKSMMKMYNGGWMMVVDMADSPDLCAARPLKTLELFPTTSTNLRESCENTTAQLQPV